MGIEAERDGVTRLLLEVRSLGREDPEKGDRLFSVVYGELRRLAGNLLRREAAGDALRPTELVHETYLRLIDDGRVVWEDRAHFFGIAARAMRRILVDQARKRNAQKHGGGATCVTLDPRLGIPAPEICEVLDLHGALDKLSSLHERIARVVELKVFGGLEMKEVAEFLGVSKRTVEGDWTFARMWFGRELSGDKGHDLRGPARSS